MKQPNFKGQTAKLFIESNDDSILGYQINQNLEIENVKTISGQKVENLVKEGWVDIRSLESEINAIPSALNDPKNPSYLDSRMKISEDFSGTNFDWFMHKVEKFKDVSLKRPIDSPDPKTFLYNETGKQSSQWSYFRMSESEKGVLFDGYQKVAGVNLGGEKSMPLSASEAYAVDAISDGLTEIKELDMVNESIAQEYDPDDEANLADNHNKIEDDQSTIESIRQAAISRNPKLQTRLPRTSSGSLHSSPVSPSPKPSLSPSSLEDTESSIPTTRRNSYQVSQELDALLYDLRDRLAQINMIGDREMPNLKIVVNNQEVYNRVNNIPQKLPAQINSEDIAYLSRVINLPEGTKSSDLNRNAIIKVDGKTVFELVAGEVLTNKLPQGQRAEDKGVVMGVDVPDPLSAIAKPTEVEDSFFPKPEVDAPDLSAIAKPTEVEDSFSPKPEVDDLATSPESPIDSQQESNNIDNSELPPPGERSPKSVLDQIKDTNYGLTFHSTFMALQPGGLEGVEGLSCQTGQSADPSVETTTIRDLSETANPRTYEVDNLTEEGILRLSSPETGEILSIKDGKKVNVVNLDDRSKNFIAKMEKALTDQSISLMTEKESQKGQGNGSQSTQTPEITDKSAQSNPKPKKDMEL